MTAETGGVPLAYEVAPGPIRVAGTPYPTGTLTALSINNRAFLNTPEPVLAEPPVRG